MNPLNKEMFYKGFRKQLAAVLPAEQAEEIWSRAGEEYQRMLSEKPELKKHKGAMVMPASRRCILSREGVSPVKGTDTRRVSVLFAISAGEERWAEV